MHQHSRTTHHSKNAMALHAPAQHDHIQLLQLQVWCAGALSTPPEKFAPPLKNTGGPCDWSPAAAQDAAGVRKLLHAPPIHICNLVFVMHMQQMDSKCMLCHSAWLFGRPSCLAGSGLD